MGDASIAQDTGQLAVLTIVGSKVSHGQSHSPGGRGRGVLEGHQSQVPSVGILKHPHFCGHEVQTCSPIRALWTLQALDTGGLLAQSFALEPLWQSVTPGTCVSLTGASEQGALKLRYGHH